MNPNTKMIIGALIAAVLAIATYYGAISQQQASSIQNQANQTIGVGPASQQQTNQPATQPQPPVAPAPTPSPR